jgi:hypothetical protein
LSLAAGQELKDLEFKMIPAAVVAGKVVDEQGEPLERAIVNLYLLGQFAAQRPAASGMGRTNDLGEFRIAGLAPGRYVLLATPVLDPAGRRTATSSGDKPTEIPLPTYFPAASSRDVALPMDVQAGQEVGGIFVKIRKGPVYRVRGKAVSSSTGISIAKLNLQLLPHEGVGVSVVYVSTLGDTRPDGSFEITNVEPGSYYLLARSLSTGARPLGYTTVDVVAADVENVFLPIGDALHVSGRLRVEGENKPDLRKTRVGLVPWVPFLGTLPSADVDEESRFDLKEVSPVKYNINLMGLPENMYIKSVRIGGQQAPGAGAIDLSGAASGVTLEILLNPDGGVIEGAALEDKKPAPGKIVTLVPDSLDQARAAYLKTSVSDQNGRFSIKGVAPGVRRQLDLPADDN